jgi:hypothetical protein
MIAIQQCDWHCGPPLPIFISRAGAITAGNQDKESPMNNVVDVRRKPVPRRASDYGMTDYEWVLAKRRMDDAMLLGHMTLRAVARIRTAMRGLSRSVRGFVSPRGLEASRGR